VDLITVIGLLADEPRLPSGGTSDGTKDIITVFGFGAVCFLFFVVPLVASIVYLATRGNRRRREPSRRTDLDPGAFREQLVEGIVRDATGKPLLSSEQIAKPPTPAVPKGVIYGGLVGLILMVLVVAVVAISATYAITDPAVAKTAILSIVIGFVVCVFIVGVVVISVAGIIWGRSDSLSKQTAVNELAESRVHTAVPVAADSVGPRQCPVCGATIPDDSPEGLCPKCVLGRCLQAPESPVLSPSVNETASYDGRSPAPLAVELATKFAGLEILELLGQGGMGAVYKARQTKLDRLVAVKVLPPEWGKDPAFAERFAREAKALARLTHPHIVAVHDFGESEGLFYLVMEYVDGANLRNILASGGLEPPEALAIIPQICDALQYAHEEGIVHRDIKPENILLDSKGRVRIADFGLAKLLNRPQAAFTLTGSQQVMGTLDYMAPEQRTRPQEVDHRADIYSLGVVFYEMLTGELPLGRFAPPSQKAGVDARLDNVVFRALEREPEQRYQRISEVKTDLESITRPTGPRPPELNRNRERDEAPDLAGLRFRVTIPAAGLLLTGFLAFVQFLAVAANQISNPHDPPLFRGLDNGPNIVFSLLFVAVSAAASMVLVIGGIKMIRLKSYTWAILASLWALLPWSCLVWPIGLTFGIWALLDLRQPKVGAAFLGGKAYQHPQPSSRPGPTGPARGRLRAFFGSVYSLVVGSRVE
jgi:serine/threonine protein kinase